MNPPPCLTSTRFIKKILAAMFFITAFSILIFTDFENEDDLDLEALGTTGNVKEGSHVALPRKVRSYNDDTASTTTGSRHPSPTQQKKKKKILAWTTIFGRDFLIYDMHKVMDSDYAFSQCPGQHTDCEWTIARSDVHDADAVVFHFFPGDFKMNDLPAYRDESQLWVHFNLEPPHRFQEGMMANVDGMFNLTATYEDDADIWLPYGFYTKRSKPLDDYLPAQKNRSAPIVWIVSRCHTLSRREIYAKELHQHIPVDIFGKCGKEAPAKQGPPLNLDFRSKLAERYYFYLAFENSDCEDYITEKFWTALLAGLVPIVRGQFPRYEKHAPPGSYINADAFFSAEDLANYLHYLIENPVEYMKYFQWRRDYQVHPLGVYRNLDIHCKLCSFLHENPNYKNVYKMSERYSEVNRCFNYHHNLDRIKNEQQVVYDDEFKGFLPIKSTTTRQRWDGSN